MKKKNICWCVVIAVVLTLTIRLTLYREDCNLLVLTGTFFIILASVFGISWSIYKVLKYNHLSK